MYHDLDSDQRHAGKIAAPSETMKYLQHVIEGIDENHVSSGMIDGPQWHMTLTIGKITTKREVQPMSVWTAREINNPDPKQRIGASMAISAAPRAKENAYGMLAIDFVEHLIKTHLPKEHADKAERGRRITPEDGGERRR